MAPKKQTAAAKAKAAAKSKAAPPVPEVSDNTALQKRLHSSLTYIGKNETPEQQAAKKQALAVYRAANSEQKHDALQRYAVEKDVSKWIPAWSREITESKKVTNNEIDGWMCEWEIEASPGRQVEPSLRPAVAVPFCHIGQQGA